MHNAIHGKQNSSAEPPCDKAEALNITAANSGTVKTIFWSAKRFIVVNDKSKNTKQEMISNIYTPINVVCDIK